MQLTSARAKRFVADTKRLYNLRIDEEILLDEAAAEIDILEDLKAKPRTGTAQLKHRAVLMRLLRQLRLADIAPAASGKPGPSDTTSKARRAAHAKWGRQG